MARRTRRAGRKANEGFDRDFPWPMMFVAFRDAYYRVLYEKFLDQIFEDLKDPEWQKLIEEFCDRALKIIERKEKEKAGGRKRKRSSGKSRR
jgi:hypothetical protein